MSEEEEITNEGDPLLGPDSATNSGQNPNQPRTGAGGDDRKSSVTLDYKEYKSGIKVFNLLCLVTGLYIPSLGTSKVLCGLAVVAEIVFFIVAAMWSISSVLFNAFVIFWCDMSIYCGYIYVLPQWVNISTDNLRLQPPTMAQFDNLQKALITAATLVHMLSYFAMFWGLYRGLSRIANWNLSVLSCCVACCRCKDEQPNHHKSTVKDTEPEDQASYLVVSPFRNGGYSIWQPVVQQENYNDYGITAQDNDWLLPDKGYWLSSILTPKQWICFIFTFIFITLVYILSVVLFFVILSRKITYYDSALYFIDIVGMVSQFLSHFLAIMTCFIFAKVTYAISNRCYDFTAMMNEVSNIDKDNPDSNKAGKWGWNELKEKLDMGNDNIDHIYILKLLDREYSQLLKKSLGSFGPWFTLHWSLHTVTAFMSIAYIADRLIMELYGSEPQDIKCNGEHDPDCILSLSFSVVFAVQHCILFLYPCLRAASITSARNGMIKAISRADWEHVSPAAKEAFIQHLERQKVTFEIPFFCVKMPFGFQVAWISLFLALIGITLKLAV